MFYLTLLLFLILIIIIIGVVVYIRNNDDSLDESNDTYKPIPPPTMQYNRTLDAPRRNPDLHTGCSAAEDYSRDPSEIKQDYTYDL